MNTARILRIRADLPRQYDIPMPRFILYRACYEWFDAFQAAIVRSQPAVRNCQRALPAPPPTFKKLDVRFYIPRRLLMEAALRSALRPKVLKIQPAVRMAHRALPAPKQEPQQ